MISKHKGTFGLLWQTARYIASFYKKKKVAPWIRDIKGEDNEVNLGNDVSATCLKIYIRGDHNKVFIGDKCSFGEGCTVRICGDNHVIQIGKRCSFNVKCGIVVSEKTGTTITIGEDCLFSYNILVRSSDDHAIYDTSTNMRINSPKNISIGDHVWVAPDVLVMKGVIVGDGAIIGARSIVTKDVPANCLVVGSPAHVVKTNVRWSEEMLSNIF